MLPRSLLQIQERGDTGDQATLIIPAVSGQLHRPHYHPPPPGPDSLGSGGPPAAGGGAAGAPGEGEGAPAGDALERPQLHGRPPQLIRAGAGHQVQWPPVPSPRPDAPTLPYHQVPPSHSSPSPPAHLPAPPTSPGPPGFPRTGRSTTPGGGSTRSRTSSPP